MEILFLFLIFAAVMFVSSWITFMPMEVKKKAPCKPHVWRYRDKDGWLSQDNETDERIREATLFCAVCFQQPSQDSGSSHGEYE